MTAVDTFSNSNEALDPSEFDDFGDDDLSDHDLANLPLPHGHASARHEDSAARSSDLASTSSARRCRDQAATARAPQTTMINSGAMRQTTLFGSQSVAETPSSPFKRKRTWPAAKRDEAPTHHELVQEALKTWVYPTNLGTIRDYQFSIVARGLFNNLLVALPTGLGKTFIAATIMLNWYRWTKTAQIVFVAPTKPLVSQQVKACFEIVGIPRVDTTLLTGSTAPGLRAEEWRKRRVFFMTPQTLINDLKTGICEPKRIVLVVVDEAHRATGNYAYVEVVKFLKRFNQSFRVLALTATPGSSIESVQAVIDGLGISRVEIRTEESIDIRQYVHPRRIDTMLFDYSEEIEMIMDLFSKALQPSVDKLCGMNVYYSKDPMSLTPYGCTQARQKWALSDAGKHAPQGLKFMIMNIFVLLASLSHATELLKYHGIGPFYHKLVAFRDEIQANGKKGGKEAKQIESSPSFQTMMSRIQSWINNSNFIGHPKLEYLQSVVLNHFLDASEGRTDTDPSSTRIMIFSHFRDSAEEIVRILQRNSPMIRPSAFVGQANTKISDGMDQKTQLDILHKFKTGVFNTLVATSIGEEGLDIGEVDLIICYDASASPIRMLQRMGRTGRKRAGNIVVLLMKGKEQNSFVKAKDNYEKMQVEIASGAKFTFHDEESRRIMPRTINCVPDKRVVEIPVENTQADLPEPTSRGRAPKRPSKKFNMPDGVRTSFVKASKVARTRENELIDESSNSETELAHPNRAPSPSPESVPPLESVLLGESEQRDFEERYLEVQGDVAEYVQAPSLSAQIAKQGTLRPVRDISHSSSSHRFVELIHVMRAMGEDISDYYRARLHPQDEERGKAQAALYMEHLAQSSQHQESPEPKQMDISDAVEAWDHCSNATFPPVGLSPTLSADERPTLSKADSFEEPDFQSRSNPETFSPQTHSLVRENEPFYLSQSRRASTESSAEDLPEVGTLMAEPSKADSVRGLQSRKRRVVEEDSDD